MTSLFSRHTKEEHADALADYLPNDDFWKAKKIDGKKLRQLLLGFARSAREAEDRLETVWEELDPSTTTLFINEWESAVGIPDDCFSGNGSIESRRLHVVIKLSAAVQTAEDFEELAALLGFTVNVKSGTSESFFPFTFPILMFDTVTSAKFTIVVEFTSLLSGGFPYTFPFTFEDDGISILRCLFNKLKPANNEIIFKQI
jgi:uncharacterized protein YmfQ (DUF2313 family)